MSQNPQFYRLTPIEPIVLGDGRPMDRQKGEVWPVPASFAAAVNGWAGDLVNRDNRQFKEDLKKSQLWGPLLTEHTDPRNPVLLVPPPADMKISSKGRFVKGEFIDAKNTLWPDDFALPKLYFLNEKEETEDHNNRVKLKNPEHELDWLDTIAWAFGQRDTQHSEYLSKYYKDAARIHVGIGKDTFTAEPGILFRSPGVSLAPTLSYVFSWKGPPILNNHHPRLVQLGGEGRMARLELLLPSVSIPPKVPDQKLPPAFLRVQLLTPALLHPPANHSGSPSTGLPFLPGWLVNQGNPDFWMGQFNGSPQLRLVAMTLGRFRAFSGWQYKNNIQSPREVRRLVPAGSVYWFGAPDGNVLSSEALNKAIQALWLQPFSSPIDSPDIASRLGFGLCLPGFTLEKSSP